MRLHNNLLGCWVDLWQLFHIRQRRHKSISNIDDPVELTADTSLSNGYYRQ